MKRGNTLFISLVAGIGLAALAVGQSIGRVTWNGGSGPIFYDRSFGVEIAVNQLWGHSQMLETEVLAQKQAIVKLEKDLKTEKDKFTKLEKRVRNMELRGK